MEEALTENINNSWSEYIEDLLINWHAESLGYNWQHLKAAKSFSYIDRIIGIPTVIANTITGTTLFASLNQEADENLIIHIVVGVIIMITAVFMAVQNFLRLSELSEKHRNAANKYKNFANSIETELALAVEERLNGKIFIKSAQKRFGELLDICPNIPEKIERQYNEFIKKNNNHFSEILINHNIHNNSKKKDDSLQNEINNEAQNIKIHEQIQDIKRDHSKKIVDRFLNHF